MTQFLKSRTASWSLAAVVCLSAVTLTISSRPLQAGDDIPIKKKDLPPVIEGVQAEAAVTVWLDFSVGNRRRPAAKKLTTLHAVMAERGYEFVQHVPLSENGDTAGMWVTYQPAR